jgi:hypothetical protein
MPGIFDPGTFEGERRPSRPNWPTPLGQILVGTGPVSALDGVKERLKWSTLPRAPFLARSKMASRQTINTALDCS